MPKPAQPPTRTRSRKRRWLRRIFLTGATLALLAIGLGAATLWYYGRGLPSVDALRDYRPAQTTRIVDRNGALLGEVFTERRTVVPLERVPRVLILSVLAAEDADFYVHEGLDYPGLVRAVYKGLVHDGPIRGTSTITQQVVKLLLLSPERTLERKIRELILARRLEQSLTKDQILELYLNNINFGHGRYGVEEAALFYFGKHVENLSLPEASLIAGVPQAPSRLSPRAHPEAARQRQLFVLGQLELKAATHWPDLTVAAIHDAKEHAPSLSPPPVAAGEAPEVVAYARTALAELIDEEAFRRGGYTVETTVDLAMQKAARTALREGLEAYDVRHERRAPFRAQRSRPRLKATKTLELHRTYDAEVTGADDASHLLRLNVGGHAAVAELSERDRNNPDGLPPSRYAETGARLRVQVLDVRDAEHGNVALVRPALGPEGAVVLIDPRTRSIGALVGGYETTEGLDRALDARRSAGSTFKPLLYALALHTRRMTPASIVLDAPKVSADGWAPGNFDRDRYRGAIRLREALAWSINSVASRVIEEVPPAELVSFAHDLGISSEMEPVESLALGTADVRPIELTNAFASFAAGGLWRPWRLVARVIGPSGEEIPLPPPAKERRVLSGAEAFVITDMMKSVVAFGTATPAQALNRPVAGKTGTSDGPRDAWFVGYTPTWVAGVWAGYDDNRRMGANETGGRAALPIWLAVMRAAHKDSPVSDFPVPAGVVRARIDPATGLLAPEGLATAIDEVFLEGTAPTETSAPADTVDSRTFLMEQLGGGP